MTAHDDMLEAPIMEAYERDHAHEEWIETEGFADALKEWAAERQLDPDDAAVREQFIESSEGESAFEWWLQDVDDPIDYDPPYDYGDDPYGYY